MPAMQQSISIWFVFKTRKRIGVLRKQSITMRLWSVKYQE
ncbi:hypothetical protein AI2991V1_5716 (plasmid) [Klebsiella oxytoca]|nr:hypothetical protein AI2991V1_5716 [Klebsiella oxytoca]